MSRFQTGRQLFELVMRLAVAVFAVIYMFNEEWAQATFFVVAFTFLALEAEIKKLRKQVDQLAEKGATGSDDRPLTDFERKLYQREQP